MNAAIEFLIEFLGVLLIVGGVLLLVRWIFRM